MAVTYIDALDLGSRTETLDFTTDRLVTSISVEFNPSSGTGARETVWDGPDGDGVGDFSWKYIGSTVTGSGPYTWALNRAGGWSADFRIRVQEVPL